MGWSDAYVIASVGTTGDSYDNALAETVNGLYKTEVIEYLKQQWRDACDVELATLEWVDWFNKTRIHSTIGYCRLLSLRDDTMIVLLSQTKLPDSSNRLSDIVGAVQF